MEYLIQQHGVLVADYPAVLGCDAAGEVMELGKGAEGVVKGDRVVFQTMPPLPDYAGYVQYAVVAANAVAKIPSKISYAEASTLPTTFFTAAVGLLAPKPEGAGLNATFEPSVKYTGKPALVMGGSTSVGQFAIQILKYLDFSPIVTYAAARHTDFLKSLGATHVVDRTTVPLADFASAFRNITSEPLSIAYASTGGQEAVDTAWKCLSKGGQLASAMPFTPKDSNPPSDGKRCWFIWGSPFMPPPNHQITNNYMPAKLSTFGLETMQKLEKLLDDGIIKPNRVKILPNGLAGILDGHEEQKNGKVSAIKLVVLPQDTPQA